jgi:large subunit ribosomal protein L22
LIIKSIDVNEGAFLKRYRPSTRGRIHPYKKRTSHIRIVLEERMPIQTSEVKNTKAIEAPKEKKEEKK